MSLGMSEQDRLLDFYGRLKGAKLPELPEDYSQFREQMGGEEQAKAFYENLKKNTLFRGVPDGFEQFSMILPRRAQGVGQQAGVSGVFPKENTAGNGGVSRNGREEADGEQAVELPEVIVSAKGGGVRTIPEGVGVEGSGGVGLELKRGKKPGTGGAVRAGVQQARNGDEEGRQPGRMEEVRPKQAGVPDLEVAERQEKREVLPDEGLPEKAGQAELDSLLDARTRLLEADGELMREWKEREKLDRLYALEGARPAASDRFYLDNRDRYAKAVRELGKLEQAIYTHPELKKRREEWKKRLVERDSVENEYRKTLEPAVLDMKYRPSSLGGRNVPVHSKDAGEHHYLDQATKLRENTRKLLSAPSRYDDSGAWGNWAKGNRDTFTDPDFWTAGILEIGRNLDVKQVYDRVLENKDGRDLEDFLTPGEKALLESYLDFLNAVDERADDLSLGYRIGKATPEVVSDILLSLVSGGVGKVASGAAKRALGNWVKKRVKGSLAKKLAKGVEHLATEGVRTVTTTVVDPRTYGRVMREVVAPEKDAEGHTVLDEHGVPVLKGWKKGILEGGRDVLAENWANGVLDRLKPLAGKYVRKRSDAEEVYEALLRATPGELRKKAWGNLARQVLQDELVAPVVETLYEKGIKALTGNPEELKELGSVEEQLKFFGTLLPVMMIKGGVKAGGLLKAERSYRRSCEQVSGLLQESGLSRQEANARLPELEGMSAGELARWAAPVVEQAGEIDPQRGRALYEAFGNFSRNKAAYHLLGGMDAQQAGRPGVPESGEAERPGKGKQETNPVPEDGDVASRRFSGQREKKDAERERSGDAGGDDKSGTIRLKDSGKDAGEAAKVYDADTEFGGNWLDAPQAEELPGLRKGRERLSGKEDLHAGKGMPDVSGQIPLTSEGLFDYRKMFEQNETGLFQEALKLEFGADARQVLEDVGKVYRKGVNGNPDDLFGENSPIGLARKGRSQKLEESFFDGVARRFQQDGEEGGDRHVAADGDAGVQPVAKRQSDLSPEVVSTGEAERTKAEPDAGQQVDVSKKSVFPGGEVAQEVTDFRGMPVEAARWLAQQQEGKVEGAFRRKELGDVDLVWSDGKDGSGLAKILDGLSGLDGTEDVDGLLERIADVVGNGKLIRNGKRRVTIQGDGFEADVRREGHRGWRLYDFRPVRKKGTVSPAKEKGRKAAGKVAGSGQEGVSGDTDTRRRSAAEDVLPEGDRPEVTGFTEEKGGNGRMRPMKGALDELMRNGEPFSWTGLLSRRGEPLAG